MSTQKSIISHSKNNIVFIAEIGSNFDGSLERALRLIELAKEAGADYVKFQHYTAESLVSEKSFEKLSSNNSHQQHWKSTVYETYNNASLSELWSIELCDFSQKIGVGFLSSPYSIHLAKHLKAYSNSCKIGSGDITFRPLIEWIDQNFDEVLLSTGASFQQEVDDAMSWLSNHNKVVLMQCNTNYLSNPLDIKFQNISVLSLWKRLYPKATLGISCHLKSDIAVLAAVAQGARVVEKHFTDDATRPGPDHNFALEPSQFALMIKNANQILNVCGNNVKKVEPNEIETRILQRRSLHLARDVDTGVAIDEQDLVSLRPCPADGISPASMHKIIGRVLHQKMAKGSMITLEDFE